MTDRPRLIANLSAEAARAIADTVPIPHGMPTQPFSRVRALWLCRAEGCSWWNQQDRTHCRQCGTERSE